MIENNSESSIVIAINITQDIKIYQKWPENENKAVNTSGRPVQVKHMCGKHCMCVWKL